MLPFFCSLSSCIAQASTLVSLMLLSAAAVPLYVRHFLSGQASGGSWRRSLASAMHARIRAVHQQSLPPSVLLPSNLPSLFPRLTSSCRLRSASQDDMPLSSLSGLAQRGAATHTSHSTMQLTNGLHTPGRGPSSSAANVAWTLALTNGHASASLSPENVSAQQEHGQTASHGSYAAAVQSQGPAASLLKSASQAAASKKASKRKGPDLSESKEHSEGRVKRPTNGLHPSVLILEQQTAQLQSLIQDSEINESLLLQ